MVVRPGSFAVLLPVKSPGSGKSRLSALPDDDRRRLAAAFATDAVAACTTTPGVALVVVVSDDDAFAASLAGDGVLACADPGGGLNAAIRHGAAMAHDLAPWGSARPRSSPMSRRSRPPTWRQPSTTQTAPSCPGRASSWTPTERGRRSTPRRTTPSTLASAPASAAAHLAAGAAPVPGELATLRRDGVDDLDGLTEALALGVGRATAAAVPAALKA